jgi:hypothetical protein
MALREEWSWIRDLMRDRADRDEAYRSHALEARS